MFRPATARSFLSLLPSSNASVARSTIHNGLLRAKLTTSTRTQAAKYAKTFALATRKPTATALTRYLSTTPRLQDEKAEVAKRGASIMQPRPEMVSADSSVGQITRETDEEADVDMMAGIRNDFV